MSIEIIKNPISRFQLRRIAKEGFGDLVKAAVDIEQRIMAIGGELHMDDEVALIEQENSKNENLWGINLYPDKEGEEFIEFDSMINIKPNSGNRNRGIDDPRIKKKIRDIVGNLIE